MKYNEILLAERREGREEGEWKKLITLVCRKLMKGEGIATISDMLEETPETVRMIADIAAKHPDDMLNHIDEYVAEVLQIVKDPQSF